MSDQNGGIIEVIKKFSRELGKANENLKKNLESANLLNLHGSFLAIVVLLSLNLGIAGSFLFFKDIPIDFIIGIVIFTPILAIAIFFLMSGFIPIYIHGNKTEEKIKSVLSFQIITFFISILLSLILHTPSPIYAGLIIFGVLLFVHPILKEFYKDTEKNNYNKSISTIYKLVFLIANIVNGILQFSNLIHL